MTDREQGFTLIETLIAFLILSLGLMIATQTIALATRSLARAREDKTILSALAKIDEGLLTHKSITFPERGAEGGIRWYVRKTAVADNSDAGFIVIRITAPSGRDIRFIRFKGGE